jgi:ubiquinone/menaquinone biosynthesis C-methylase UbiE
MNPENPANPENPVNEWRENAQYWVKHCATIKTMFAPLTASLIEHAGIRAGQSVLDVAGGAGEPSLTIAETVGPEGSVTCTDAVPEMIAAAQTKASDGGVKNVQFHVCTADSLPFPDNSFDAAVSRLGIMFFPDPVAAVRELLRVTRPGGSVTFAVWHKSELNPFCYIFSRTMDQHVAAVAADADAPGAFRFAEPGKLSRVMTDAGAVDVAEHTFKFDLEAPVTPLDVWTLRSETSDTLRTKLKQLPPDERSQVAQEVQDALREVFPYNQMKCPAQMIIATGRKPN